ncbi:MAG: radical SAM protein [Gemmatimonadota bacterium]|nr:radical SAM protein [Gemmatimonadota bacterium]
MIDDLKKNPGLLKLDLYCKGMRIGEDCRTDEDGGRRVLRTRAGLGSGLEVILPGGLYTNIPVTEDFAAGSPFVLHRSGPDGGYVIYREDEPVAPVTLAPRPAWYDRATSHGTRMNRIGTLQGTYLGIYPAKVCQYWEEEPRSNCKFCSVGLNLGHDDALDKTVEDVVETVGAAVAESRITYVDFNTGHYEGDTYLDILEPYIRAVKKSYGLLIGVQTPPHHDLARYRHLKKIGVNRVSFCFELWDTQRFQEVCPGKHRQYGLDRYLEAIEYCASVFHTTNGEIVAGLESPESSIEAIDWITSVGAVPTVCVFRPLKGTDYENVPPPETGDMVPVFRRMYEACMEKGLMIGVAPNVKVSLVMLPEEGRYLTDNPNRFFFTRAKFALMRPLFKAALKMKLL